MGPPFLRGGELVFEKFGSAVAGFNGAALFTGRRVR